MLQHARRLLWGFYTLRFYPHESLIEAVAKHVEPAVQTMEPYDLCNFIWAFGGFGHQPSNMQLFLQVSMSLLYMIFLSFCSFFWPFQFYTGVLHCALWQETTVSKSTQPLYLVVGNSLICVLSGTGSTGLLLQDECS